MSLIEMGIEKGYIEKQPSKDELVERYVIYPRRIMTDLILSGIINEFNVLGYTVEFDSREKVYRVDNIKLLKEKQKDVTESLLKVEEAILSHPAYSEFRDNFIGFVLATAKVTNEEPEKVMDVFYDLLQKDTTSYCQSTDYRKMFALYDESEKLLRELDEFIRSM